MGLFGTLTPLRDQGGASPVGLLPEVVGPRREVPWSAPWGRPLGPKIPPLRGMPTSRTVCALAPDHLWSLTPTGVCRRYIRLPAWGCPDLAPSARNAAFLHLSKSSTLQALVRAHQDPRSAVQRFVEHRPPDVWSTSSAPGDLHR